MQKNRYWLPVKPGRHLTKILMVMRMTAFLLTAFFVHVYAAGVAQTVTLSGKNISLKEFFSTIEKQTGYVVFVNSQIFSQSKTISLSVTNKPLREVLNQALQGEALDYTILDKTIIVSRKPVAPALPTTAGEIMQNNAPPVRVSGRIIGTMGQGLPAVNVLIKGSGKGTVTNEQGWFNLDVNEGDVLTVSSIGFTPITIRFSNGVFYTQENTDKKKKGGNRSLLLDNHPNALVIEMSITTNELDEAVIIGYGTTSRRFNTSSMTTVTSKQIENQPVMNPELALRGLVPGLVITPKTGYANSPIKMEIRGRNNINKMVSSEPLVLIDGMPITIMNLNNTDQTGGSNILPDLTQYQIANNPSGGQSPLFGLNPMDIASITVLKDADATAIYGSRGANGVILITTKKGHVGKSTFNVNISKGVTLLTRRYPMLNTSQYVAMRKAALAYDGLPMDLENAPDLTAWDTTRNVDWQKELWGHAGNVTRVNTGLSGGNNNTTFRLSGGFGKQADLLTVSGGSEATSFAASIEHHSTNQKFTASLSAIYSHGKNDAVNQYGLASSLAPNTPAMYDSTGALNYAPWNAGGLALAADFPFGGLLQRTIGTNNNLNSNLTLDYKVLKGLDAKVSVGYNNAVNLSQATNPIKAQNPANNPTGTATFSTVNNEGWTIEPQINYNNKLGPGTLGVLIGSTIQSSTSRYNVENGRDYPNDDLLRSIMNAPTQEAYDGAGQYKYAGIFGRINYEFFNRYVINLSGRRDGSSRFGPGNQFGNFGSVAAAWILSEESWIRNALPKFVDFIKLRGSYGITGSDGVADYQYLSQWSSGTGKSLIPGYGNIARPLVNQHAVNQYYRWQANKSLNQGLELGFLPDSKLSIMLEHYQNRCSNQLLNFPTPIYSGFSSVTANWPATVQNSGWELTLSANKIIATKDFTWSASFNVSRNRNIIAAYPNIEGSPYYTQLSIGRSLSAVYLYHYLGVDPMTGIYSFEDYNHDGAIESNSIGEKPGAKNTDNRIMKDMAPKFTGGFNTTFTYKGLNIAMIFDFKNAIGKNAYATTSIPGTQAQNVPVEVYRNFWRKPGDQTQFETASTGKAEVIDGSLKFSSSDGVYTDASFLRLNSLMISYSLPASVMKKLNMQGLSFYMSSQSVFVLTKYKGTDPEIQNFNQMPQPRIFTGGVSLNF